MRKIGLAVGVVWLLVGGSAEASTTISADSGTSRPYQRWIDQAKIPTPSVEVVVHEAWCPDEAPWGGQAPCAQGNEIWIGWPRYARGLFYHEVGHIFDWAILDDTERDAFRQMIADPRAWTAAPNAPQEQFAEAYQWCARFDRLPRLHKRTGPRWSSAYGYKPTQRQHAGACNLIDASSGWSGTTRGGTRGR